MDNIDVFYQLPMGAVRIDGTFDNLIKLITEKTLKKVNFRYLADYYRNKLDQFATGEFWGKLMRAGSLIYKYSQDESLKAVLDATAEDMLSIQLPDGCISTVPCEKQPNGTHGSDLWERKYSLLGLLGYYEITGREDVLEAIKRAADYTISQVGLPPKTPITETGWAFCGIESSSILEPIVKIYHITGEKRYLDFATYIVESGACSRENLFESIYNGKDPKDIGNNGVPEESIAKAYEMMSCFEGLVEYYRATGIEKYKETALIFYNKLLEKEITLLGSGGADAPYNLGPGTGEQWNYTRLEQTNPDITLMMETCVTVTWMKLCYQLLRLTGDATIADQIEVSAYNILIGAIRPDGEFFEYFPRFNGLRNPKVNYSFNIDGFDLSCCTANGPSGLGLVPFTAFMNSKKGPVIQFYETGSADFDLSVGGQVSLTTKSEYPRKGIFTATISKVETDKEFSIMLRVPAWCSNYSIKINGNDANVEVKAGTYAEVSRQWQLGDTIEVNIELTVRVFESPKGSNRLGDNQVAVMRGPIVLARDARTGEDINSPVLLKTATKEGTTLATLVEDKVGCIPCNVCVKVATDDGKEITMIDYFSAGSTWDEKSEFCSWMKLSSFSGK